jgi:hypothetical protein
LERTPRLPSSDIRLPSSVFRSAIMPPKIRVNLYDLWTATPLPPANPGIKFVNKTHFLTPRVSPICHCLSA